MRRLLAVGLSAAFVLTLLAPAVAWAADPVPDPSDHFADATLIPGMTTPGFSMTKVVDMTGATYPDPDGEPAPCGGTPTRTVWYKFHADMSWSAVVTTSGSNVGNPVVSGFLKRLSDGGITSFCGSAPYSGLTFTAYKDGNYYIQASDDGTGGRTLQLAISFSSVPPNDSFNRARSLASFWSTDLIEISSATYETGETHPYCWGANRTAWYRYAPPAGSAPAALTFDAVGPPFRGHALAAYVGTGPVSSLTPLGCGYDHLVFNVQAGNTYYIQVSDVEPPAGLLTLGWSLGPPADLIPPTILGTPADMTVLTTDPTGAVVTYTQPTAFDAVSGAVPVTCTPASGTLFPLGYTTVTCRARDAAGNRAQTTFKVTVQQMVEAPAVVPIVSYDVFATPISGWCGNTHDFDGTRVDTGRMVQGECYAKQLVDEMNGSGSLNDGLVPLGYVGNQLFSLHSDITTGAPIHPRIVLRLDGTYRVTAISFHGGGPYGTPEPGAIHAVTVGIGGSAVHLPTVPFGPGGYFGAASDRVDLAGTALAATSTSTIILSDLEAFIDLFQTAYNTFTIGEIVVEGEPLVDTTPPVLTLPSDITAEASSSSGAAVTYTASALDAVDGPVPVTCDHESGSTFPLGPTTVDCSATDAAGNLASDSFIVKVVDTVPPTPSISGVASQYPVDTGISITGSASDLVDPAPAVACTLAGPNGMTTVPCVYSADAWSLGALGTYTFAVVATDASGNTATGTATFDIVATYPSVRSLTSAWTKKASVAKDLVNILDSAYAAEQRGQYTAEANKLKDYRAAVKAQSGKAIDADKADLLITFSYGL